MIFPVQKLTGANLWFAPVFYDAILKVKNDTAPKVYQYNMADR